MTDHADDETLSAFLDGEAAPGHLAGCAACQARVEELRAAASAVGSPVPAPDPARREAAIALALGADLAAGPARRRLPLWLGAAAALLAVLAFVPLLTRGGNDGGRPGRTAAPPAAESKAAADSASGSATALAAPAPIPLGALGEVDATTLATAVRRALATGTEAAPPPMPRCAERLADFGALSGYGAASVGGTPADVLVFRSGAQVRIVAVIGADCRILVSTTYQA